MTPKRISPEEALAKLEKSWLRLDQYLKTKPFKPLPWKITKRVLWQEIGRNGNGISVIAGTNIAANQILQGLNNGLNFAEILDKNPGLTSDQVKSVLAHAMEILQKAA